MKKSILLKSMASVLMGALLPLSAVQALDLQDRIRMEGLGESKPADMRSAPSSDMHSSEQYGTQAAPQGAQGPMRSDMKDDDQSTRHSADRSPQRSTEEINRDIEKRLYPIGGAGTP